MLHILAGPDEFSVNQALEEIKKDIGDQTVLANSMSVLDGQQVTIEQLRQICETAPFLAERRLVIVNGLLGRFEPGRRTRRRPATNMTQRKKEEYSQLSNYLLQIPDSTVVVLIEDRVGNNNPLLKELTAKAKIRSFPLLRDTRLRQWAQQRVKENNAGISAQAIDLLARLVGSNLWVMSNEIDKLILFTSGRQIEVTDVKALVSYDYQADVFTMIDAIVEFKSGVAERLLEQLLRRGAAPTYLLSVLSRQIQRIVRAKELVKQKTPNIEIQNKLGLVSEFALRKTLEQATRYSLARLRIIYRQLLETDLAIKTGRYDAGLALNILVAELCQRDIATVPSSRSN